MAAFITLPARDSKLPERADIFGDKSLIEEYYILFDLSCQGGAVRHRKSNQKEEFETL
jgi:hypothetical protein